MNVNLRCYRGPQLWSAPSPCALLLKLTKIILFNIQLGGGWTSWVHVSPHLYSWSLSSDVFVLITYTDRTSLYCSSEYLIVFEMEEVQAAGPTAFCTLAGLCCSWLLPANVKAPIMLQTVKKQLNSLQTIFANMVSHNPSACRNYQPHFQTWSPTISYMHGGYY